MSILHSAKQNQIISALPVHEYTRILPFLELMDLSVGEVIYEPNITISYVYFPTSCIVARIYQLESGLWRQVSMIGKEGVTGTSLLLGCDSTPATVIVQSPGYAYRIKANILKKELKPGGTLQRLLLSFTQALLLQTEQSAVDHRQTIMNQLCRFLLMTEDRSSGSSFPMTHELVGNMLGVRRESVTTAALTLQAEGAITYRRGHITVVNRELMEDRVSEAYAGLKKEYHRLLSNKPETEDRYVANVIPINKNPKPIYGNESG
ncbi:Crp/Fnr family transcriptional regulator [Nitrosospira sp. NpAV]|uniref:Crp/Fnr family transcriptional regulator n=1 Tax=Nitrosospira sp. NpAV TaxID=58133 RepID=UPI0009FC3DC5|nr:Crp/Fnr family transcriptional regulator [Nitrosospira sp. NpAV]